MTKTPLFLKDVILTYLLEMLLAFTYPLYATQKELLHYCANSPFFLFTIKRYIHGANLKPDKVTVSVQQGGDFKRRFLINYRIRPRNK